MTLQPHEPDMDRELTAADVAAECRVSAETAREWMRKGIMLNGQLVRLSASRSIGRRFRTTARELAAFRETCLRVRGLVAVAEIPTAAERARADENVRKRIAKFLSR